MGHTRGGGIGNLAGSYDHTRGELLAELRERIVRGGGYGDITEDELKRLVGETESGTEGTLRARWNELIALKKGAPVPDWLPVNDWLEPVQEVQNYINGELQGFELSFDLRWKADMRAIKRWQSMAPEGEDRSLTWPDHADLVVWLLEQLERATAKKEEKPND